MYIPASCRPFFLPPLLNQQCYIGFFREQGLIGRLRQVYGKVHNDQHLWAPANYRRPEGLHNGFAAVEQHSVNAVAFLLIYSHLTNFQISVFWENDSSGVLQRPDYFSTIVRKVLDYRQDIEFLTPTTKKASGPTKSS